MRLKLTWTASLLAALFCDSSQKNMAETKALFELVMLLQKGSPDVCVMSIMVSCVHVSLDQEPSVRILVTILWRRVNASHFERCESVQSDRAFAVPARCTSYFNYSMPSYFLC